MTTTLAVLTAVILTGCFGNMDRYCDFTVVTVK